MANQASIDQIVLWYGVQQFYAREAHLLDDREFHQWLDLMTEDIFYWMPMRRNRLRKEMKQEITGPGELAYFEESKRSLQVRVARLDTGMAWAEDPPSRTRHIVSNIMIDGSPGNTEIGVQSSMLVYRTALEKEIEFFVGYREDVLRDVGGEWKLAKRTIVLDEATLSEKNLSVFF